MSFAARRDANMPVFLTDIDPRKLALWSYQQWREDGGTPEIILKIAEELGYLAQEEIAEEKE